MAITITIPVSLTDDGQRLRWLCKWYKEFLIDQHNYMGIWHTSGATLNQYNNLLCTYLKNRYPYSGANVPILSDVAWNDFVSLHQRVNYRWNTYFVDFIESIKIDATVIVDVNAISGD